jgi:hypothetical protein
LTAAVIRARIMPPLYSKNEGKSCTFQAHSGGDEGDRTPYLLNAIQALSQVSYTPTER